MGNEETNGDRGALERIIALLFALANLADLAAGASFLRRRQVLGILSCGEIEARAFVFGMAIGELVSADELKPAHDDMRLATNFRALALLLCAMLARRFALSCATVPQICWPPHSMPAPPVRRLAPPPASDTS